MPLGFWGGGQVDAMTVLCVIVLFPKIAKADETARHEHD